MTTEAEIVKVLDYTNVVIATASIISVILAPIIAVLIAQWLQKRAQVRNDKMLVFSTLMTYRIMNHIDQVKAYNMIDIVFCNSPEVRTQWKDYRATLNEKNFNPTTSQTEKHKLLEKMAKDLGYKDKITWETIQNPYYPIWVDEAINKNEKFSNGQATLADMLTNISPEMMNGFFQNFAMNQQTKHEDGKKEEN